MNKHSEVVIRLLIYERIMLLFATKVHSVNIIDVPCKHT